MSLVGIVTGIAAAVGSLAVLGRQLAALRALAREVLPRRSGAAYENLLLELIWEIQDRRGLRAVLDRRQRIRFLRDEAEVVRELAWGEGEQLARYRVRGARRMLVRPEGSRQAVLLGLHRRLGRGDQLTLSTRRFIRAAFRDSTEYCETMLERPTRRVTLTVIFPRGRPPYEAHVTATPEERRSHALPIRFGADGRAFLRWSRKDPSVGHTYSLRWSW
jgi:hypothetical protein